MAPRWYNAQAYTMLVLLLLMATPLLGAILGPPLAALRGLVLGVAGVEA